MPVKLRPQHLTVGNKLARAIWGVVWLLLYRPSPTPLHGWRRLLKRMSLALVSNPSMCKHCNDRYRYTLRNEPEFCAKAR